MYKEIIEVATKKPKLLSRHTLQVHVLQGISYLGGGGMTNLGELFI